MINIFYACDDRYVPFLTVSLTSLIENASDTREYNITVLHSGLSNSSIESVKELKKNNIKIDFCNVSDKLKAIADQLELRDYYTLSIYYRIFIPELFPHLQKAVYLDADTVLLKDVALLYDTDVSGFIAAAVPDAVVASEDIFIRYANEGVGVHYREYFNSGVMVMNLKRMREENLQGTFIRLLKSYHFNTICPDQDYLNVICRGKIKYLGSEWNRMTVDTSPCGEIGLVHYNMFFKPWLYKDVQYSEHFWRFAEKTDFFAFLKNMQSEFGESDELLDIEAGAKLRKSAEKIINEDRNFCRVLENEESAV